MKKSGVLLFTVILLVFAIPTNATVETDPRSGALTAKILHDIDVAAAPYAGSQGGMIEVDDLQSELFGIEITSHLKITHTCGFSTSIPESHSEKKVTTFTIVGMRFTGKLFDLASLHVVPAVTEPVI